MDAVLTSFRTSFNDDETVIANYKKRLNEELRENLRKIITETEGVTRDLREEIKTNEKKYNKLHAKHKDLQSTINNVYSKTTKYFGARQTPKVPTPPFRGAFRRSRHQR